MARQYVEKWSCVPGVLWRTAEGFLDHLISNNITAGGELNPRTKQENSAFETLVEFMTLITYIFKLKILF